MARPKSAAYTDRVYKVHQLSLEGKKKSEIARELDISSRQVDKDLGTARKWFAVIPAQEAVNEHQRRLIELAEALEEQVFSSRKLDLWAVDRYRAVLADIERITGLAYDSRKAGEKKDSNAEIDRWLAFCVESGMSEEQKNETEEEFFARVGVVEEYDDVLPEELNADDELDMQEQHMTGADGAEAERKARAAELRKSPV